MKRTSMYAILFLLGASLSFAWDEFLPLKPGHYGASVSSGRSFEDDGELSPYLKGKVGLLPFVALEVAQGAQVENSPRGFLEPSLALKWSASPFPSLAFVTAVNAPVGTEAVVGKHPATSFDVAMVAEFEILGATANGYVAYSFSPHDFTRGGFDFYADPVWALGETPWSYYQGMDVLWTPLQKPTLGFWPGIDYTWNDWLGTCGDLDIDWTVGDRPTIGVTLAAYVHF